MKSNFNRFLHYTLSYLDRKPDTASALSYSDLIGVSRSNKVANLSNLDYRVKPDNDSEGADHRVKPDGDSVCAGRSMVEMLGVLAIIGVLSVGAIAGYSKAMFKYKLNKATNQISMLVANIRTAYYSQGNYDGLNAIQAKKLGIVPNDMYTSISDYNITNPFGGDVGIDLSWDTDASAFMITYGCLPTEACIALATADWGFNQDSGLIAVGVGSTGRGIWDEVNLTEHGSAANCGSEICVITPENGAPMTPSQAFDVCANSEYSEYCMDVVWKYR